MMRHTRLALPALLIVLAACGDRIVAPSNAPDSPALATSSAQLSPFIVVFNDNVSDAPGLARQLSAAYGAQLRFTYSSALKGFAADLPAAAVQALRNNPNVDYVEPDPEVMALVITTQTPATWGIDRVDQRDLPLNNSYSYNNSGAGVNAYILDTGLRLSHSEFGGRASFVPNGSSGNFVGDGRTAEDCHGHGTHVAGTVGGATYGVAKGVRIWAARVVNCRGSGQVSMAIAAVDWVTANALRPAVVNMSLGYGNVPSLRTAVQNSVASGVVYSVAAGNGDFFGTPQNACNESPAGAADALTVGATNNSDGEASFSNYGPCVDILAPGVGVTSAWYKNDTQTNTISGTSMATPHVAGAAALYLAANPASSPAAVANALKSNASANTINLHGSSTSGGTPNLFLYTLFIGESGDPPPDQPPTASFTYSCSALSCNFNGSGSFDDGSIVAYDWDFGDASSGSGVTPSHTYGAAGSYQVELTVTDNLGAQNSTVQTVVVSEAPPPPPPGDGIVVTANAYKVKGNRFVDLSWTTAGFTDFVLFRNFSPLGIVTGNSFSDSLGKGGGTVTYYVCPLEDPNFPCGEVTVF